MSAFLHIEVRRIDAIAAVRFIDRKILEPTAIQEMGEELFSLVDEHGYTKIVLNFSGVEFLSSAAMGKLITLHKKVMTSSGHLTLCNIRPEIFEVFAITRLNHMYKFYDDEATALEFCAQVAVDIECPMNGCEGVTRAPIWNPVQGTGKSVRCNACQAESQMLVVPDKSILQVSQTVIPSYDGEYVTVKSRHPYELALRGRLDLFASETLQVAWETIPARQGVLVDLRELTAFDKAGVDALCKILSDPAHAKPNVVVVDANSAEQCRALGQALPVYVELKEARQALAQLNGEPHQPLLARVQRLAS